MHLNARCCTKTKGATLEPHIKIWPYINIVFLKTPMNHDYSCLYILQCLTKVLGGRRPLLYSYQGSLPKLPVPGLKDTMKRVRTNQFNR